MVERVKSLLYFPIAHYFRFFAMFRLRRWNPRIIVVTGSNGKTTLLHLLESQIRDKAKFSHHANSAYGIPFDILDLHRKTLQRSEWINLFLKAPLQAFAKPPKEKIYVVEADCDRPEEGKFLASLLRPEVVLWTSVSGTHGMNFDSLIAQKSFSRVDEAIAYEFGHFLAYCQKLAIINGDSQLQKNQKSRTKADVIEITKNKHLQKYTIDKTHTEYKIDGKVYTFAALLPEEIFYSIAMCRQAMGYLALPFDDTFSRFILPPGRSSLFRGIKDTTLVDSSYNGNLSSILAVLHMFEKLPIQKKWVVVGDMLELGENEKAEHEKLAETLAKMNLEKVILIGQRNQTYTAPALEHLVKNKIKVSSFMSAKDALEEIKKNVDGGEAILFKGSQSLLLEGVIEPLLADKKDAQHLPRRGAFWEKLRTKRGL